MSTIEIVQQYGNFYVNNNIQAIAILICGFIASVLVIWIMNSKGTKRMVFIGGFLPLAVLTAVTLQETRYQLLKSQETAAKLLDSVINKESNLAEAYRFGDGFRFRIQPGAPNMMGAQVTAREYQIVIALEGAEKLNEIYLLKNGVAMIPAASSLKN